MANQLEAFRAMYWLPNFLLCWLLSHLLDWFVILATFVVPTNNIVDFWTNVGTSRQTPQKSEQVLKRGFIQPIMTKLIKMQLHLEEDRSMKPHTQGLCSRFSLKTNYWDDCVYNKKWRTAKSLRFQLIVVYGLKHSRINTAPCSRIKTSLRLAFG